MRKDCEKCIWVNPNYSQATRCWNSKGEIFYNSKRPDIVCDQDCKNHPKKETSCWKYKQIEKFSTIENQRKTVWYEVLKRNWEKIATLILAIAGIIIALKVAGFF